MDLFPKMLESLHEGNLEQFEKILLEESSESKKILDLLKLEIIKNNNFTNMVFVFIQKLEEINQNELALKALKLFHKQYPEFGNIRLRKKLCSLFLKAGEIEEFNQNFLKLMRDIRKKKDFNNGKIILEEFKESYSKDCSIAYTLLFKLFQGNYLSVGDNEKERKFIMDYVLDKKNDYHEFINDYFLYNNEFSQNTSQNEWVLLLYLKWLEQKITLFDSLGITDLEIKIRFCEEIYKCLVNSKNNLFINLASKYSLVSKNLKFKASLNKYAKENNIKINDLSLTNHHLKNIPNEKAEIDTTEELLLHRFPKFNLESEKDPNQWRLENNLKKAIDYVPDSQLEKDWKEWVVCMFHMGLHHLSIDVLDKVLSISNSPKAEIYYLKAMALKKLKINHEAIEQIELGLLINDESPLPLLNLKLEILEMEDNISEANELRNYIKEFKKKVKRKNFRIENS